MFCTSDFTFLLFSSSDEAARTENIDLEVTFTNGFGKALQWIKDNLQLDLTKSIVTNASKTVSDVVVGVLQTVTCGAIEDAAKMVVREARDPDQWNVVQTRDNIFFFLYKYLKRLRLFHWPHPWSLYDERALIQFVYSYSCVVWIKGTCVLQ